MEENKEVLMSEQQVFDVINFASMFGSGFGTEMIRGIPWSGVFTPDLVNSAYKQINNNPLTPTADNIPKALYNPNNNEAALVGYSEWFHNTNMMYKRTNNYLSKMLSYDFTYSVENLTPEDVKSKEYQQDLAIVERFFRKFNWRREFGKLTDNLMRQETVFTTFRDDSSTYAFQQLPSKYCIITGDAGFTKLFDFNMLYFYGQVPGVDINSYAPIFKQYFYDTFTGSGDENYRPSNPLVNRNGEFVYWHQTSPDDNFFCFKFSPEIYTQIPYLAPLMPDGYNMGIIRQLQMNKNIASARALIMGEVGFLENTKSGQVADQLNLSPTTLATFLQLVKGGLEEVWKLGGLPLENLKKFQFEDPNKDMYNNQLSLTSGQSVALSRIIYSTDKLSSAEVSVKLQTDGNLMRALYKQYEDFINFYLAKKTRKYKFTVKFEGLDYDEDRSSRFDTAMQAAEMGLVLPQKIAASMGMSPFEFKNQLTEAQNNDFTEKLVSLISVHTASASNKGGRPQKKGQLRSQSRDYDTSQERGG